MNERQDWYRQRLLDEVAWAFVLEAGADGIHPRERKQDAQRVESQPPEPVSNIACPV